MKCFNRFTGLFVLTLLAGLWCFNSSAVAGSKIDLGQMPLDEVADRLGKDFDSIDSGFHNSRNERYNRYRRPGHFDPNAFEFLLSWTIEKVARRCGHGFSRILQNKRQAVSGNQVRAAAAAQKEMEQEVLHDRLRRISAVTTTPPSPTASLPTTSIGDCCAVMQPRLPIRATAAGSME